MFALGTRQIKFMEGLITQLAAVGVQGASGGAALMDFLLAATKGIEPRDQVEAMLAAQMAATHLATMQMAVRVGAAQTREGRESAERSFNRCARTFTSQTETLKRYWMGGEQKVTVQHQHVTVNDGGQAVVVGRGKEEKMATTPCIPNDAYRKRRGAGRNRSAPASAARDRQSEDARRARRSTFGQGKSQIQARPPHARDDRDEAGAGRAPAQYPRALQ